MTERPKFGNPEWFKMAFEKAPQKPTTTEGKEIAALQAQILALEQMVTERDQLIAFLKDKIEQSRKED